MKRKSKLLAKNPKEKLFKEDISIIPEEDGPLSNKVVVEHKNQVVYEYGSAEEWPFESFAESLTIDLFSPCWEIRHGAALGLRDLIKIHGEAAGKVGGNRPDANQALHNRWLEDLCIRLLCVLALDRFADFVGDSVVVPVRETAAQTLGVVLQFCSADLCLRVMYQGLLPLIEFIDPATRTSKWEVRHAGLIGLKYWLGVREDLVEGVLVSKDNTDTGVFKAIINGLSDKDDDVRSTSSTTLIPITSTLLKFFTPLKIFKSIVINLWDCLRDLDDLTSATTSVMELLSNLIMHPEIIDIMKSTNLEGYTLDVLVPRLYGFFRHAISRYFCLI